MCKELAPLYIIVPQRERRAYEDVVVEEQNPFNSIDYSKTPLRVCKLVIHQLEDIGGVLRKAIIYSPPGTMTIKLILL